MRLIRGLHNLLALAGRDDSPLRNGCVATIGNFDGVHLGHQTIIEQVREKALALGLPSVVMIFEPQPREFFQGEDAPSRLMRFREKYEALRDCGVDLVVCLHFNSRLRQLSGNDFAEQVVCHGLTPRHLVVGDDFRFGYDRKGDFHLLQEVGRSAGFSVAHTRTISLDGDRVSSTRIRQCLTENALVSASRLLGRPYSITGTVIHGQALGRQIGVPTANIRLGPTRPPLSGVYVVAAEDEAGERHWGVANIGLRPTVNGRRPLLETHLFDFAGALYGQRLHVTFLHHLRDEVRFADIAALTRQIQADIETARHWLAEHPDPLVAFAPTDTPTIPD